EALLAELNEGQERLSKAAATLTRFRHAVLAAACSGKLTERWRLEHDRMESAVERVGHTDELPAVDGLPDLPESWTYRALRKISDRVSVGHVGPTSRYYCRPGRGVAFVRSQNVR